MEFSMRWLMIMMLISMTGNGAQGIGLHDLKQSLFVTATVIHNGDDLGQNVAKAGKDEVQVAWSSVENSIDGDYKKVIAKLCFTKESQKDRAWRKTDNEDLSKDKTCQKEVGAKEWTRNGNLSSVVAKDVPKGYYFVRVYVVNSLGNKVAYGQTPMDGSIITMDPISGRHPSLDIATAIFSAVSVLSLFGFFGLEKMRKKNK